MKLSDDERDNITEHVVGTHMDDLTQIYNRRTIIKGSVNILHALVSNKQDSFFEDTVQFRPIVNEKESVEKVTGSQIVVNGMPFDLLDINQQYWMKNVDQVSAMERDSRI